MFDDTGIGLFGPSHMGSSSGGGVVASVTAVPASTTHTGGIGAASGACRTRPASKRRGFGIEELGGDGCISESFGTGAPSGTQARVASRANAIFFVMNGLILSSLCSSLAKIEYVEETLGIELSMTGQYGNLRTCIKTWG